MIGTDSLFDLSSPVSSAFRSSLLGPISLITAPSGAVLTTAEAKAQCKVDISDDDTLIDSLVSAATAFCEQEIYGHRQFLTATYDVPVVCWWEGLLKLPRPPLASVTHVKYYDTNGTQQTLASTYYTVRTPWKQPGSVERAPDQTFPSVQSDRRYPITIRLVAGYGAASAVPPQIGRAHV